MESGAQSATQREIYLTPNEVSDYFGRKIGIQTLNNWRSNACRTEGGGPPFLKAGGKVLYPLSYLKAWEAERMRGHLRH